MANVGRPIVYNQDYDNQAYKICKIFGATDQEVADFFNIVRSTLYEWKLNYPSFKNAIAEGRATNGAYISYALTRKTIKNKTKRTKHYRDYSNKYIQDKLKTDSRFKLRCDMSCYLRGRLLSKTELGRLKYLDYTAKELRENLEAKFDENMTWENYGTYWQIDHIIPDSWFDYETEEDKGFQYSWSLNNLQPLASKDNIEKGNRYAG